MLSDMEEVAFELAYSCIYPCVDNGTDVTWTEYEAVVTEGGTDPLNIHVTVVHDGT